MKHPYLVRFLALSAVYLAAGNPAFAQTTMTAATGSVSVVATTAGTATAVVPPTATPRIPPRLVGQFTAFAGSTTDARDLVIGLRQGTPITLGTGAAATTITPPTGHMGWGNVRHALSIARAELAAAGIANPTPEQIRIALTGGTLTTTSIGSGGTTTTRTQTLPGVLTLRSDGMGWGQISHRLGVDGALRHGGRITTAAGSPASALHHRHDGRADTQGTHRGSQRIVTASGASASTAGLARAENHRLAGQGNHGRVVSAAATTSFTGGSGGGFGHAQTVVSAAGGGGHHGGGGRGK